MISAATGLMRKILGMEFPWNIWVGILGGVNVIGGLWFWSSAEGKATIAAMVAAFVVMVGIYSRFGFVRLLGLGHILSWVPLLVFLGVSLRGPEPEGAFRTWIWCVVILNGISLVIDVADVVRYARGERKPV